MVNTVELMDRIIAWIKKEGYWIDEMGDMPIDYCSPHYVFVECGEEEAWDMSVRASADFGGSEGIYVDVTLDLPVKEAGVRQSGNSICTIKTLSDSDEAYIAYSVLAARIQLYGNRILAEYLREIRDLEEVAAEESAGIA